MFLSGKLGIGVKEHCLSKARVSLQLLNYKRERFGFQQVAVIIRTSDLERRIHEGMLLSLDAFVAQTLSQIHSPGNPSYGLDFNNLCAALSAQPAKARTFVKMLAQSPGNTCSKLLVDVVENWIKIMADTFPAAGKQNAQIGFDRGRELRLQSFVTELIEEYDASGLTPSVISRIGFGNLGRFLHQVIFWRGHILYVATRSLLLNFLLIVLLVSMQALSYITSPADHCIVPQRHWQLQGKRGPCFLNFQRHIL